MQLLSVLLGLAAVATASTIPIDAIVASGNRVNCKSMNACISLKFYADRSEGQVDQLRSGEPCDVILKRHNINLGQFRSWNP